MGPGGVLEIYLPAYPVPHQAWWDTETKYELVFINKSAKSSKCVSVHDPEYTSNVPILAWAGTVNSGEQNVKF